MGFWQRLLDLFRRQTETNPEGRQRNFVEQLTEEKLATAADKFTSTALDSTALWVPPECRIRKQRPVTRDSEEGRTFELNERDAPIVDGRPFGVRCAEWLAPEKHARYRPLTKERDGRRATWCNILTKDYCDLWCGVFLPHAWWTAAALVLLRNGQPLVGKDGRPIGDGYDSRYKNELSANGLHDWFSGQWAPRYRWRRLATAAEAQAAADAGDCVVVVAKSQPGGIGHVAVVVPSMGEAAPRGYAWTCQAGARNWTRAATMPWWDSPRFSSRGFFACSPAA